MTPCLFGLYSIVTLLAQHLFADAIAAVRRCLWSHAYFSMSPKATEMVKIPRPLVERFVDALCYAA